MIQIEDELKAAFVQVAQLARVPIDIRSLHYECLPAPCGRPGWRPHTQVVYAFFIDDRCLKVGKAGPKSKARFTSQHYGVSVPSTLARSILDHRQSQAGLLSPSRR